MEAQLKDGGEDEDYWRGLGEVFSG